LDDVWKEKRQERVCKSALCKVQEAGTVLKEGVYEQRAKPHNHNVKRLISGP